MSNSSEKGNSRERRGLAATIGRISIMSLVSRRGAMAMTAGTVLAGSTGAFGKSMHLAAVDRATYGRYIAAFNARDIPGFTQFYAPDVAFLLGPREMHGRQAIIDWYELAWARIEEHCEVRRFISDKSGVAAELETQFRAVADWPEFTAGPLLKGDVLRRIGFIHYDSSPTGFTRVATASHRVLEQPAHWSKS
jgi:hypothetical protein